MNRKISTSCKECCFAVYEDVTQVDCAASRLEVFRKVKTQIIEAYDENKQFYVIANRICLYKRSTEWYETLTQDCTDDVLAAREEIPFKYHVVIIGDKFLTDILATVNDIAAQSCKPYRITVVRPKGTTTNMSVIRQSLTATQCPVWKLENILDPEIDTLDQYLRLSLINNKCPYVAIFNAGTQIDSNVFEKLSNRVINDLFQFAALISPNTEDGLIIPSIVWDYYRLTRADNTPLLEQLIEDSKECKNKIFPISILK